jgi:hypothetical protein
MTLIERARRLGYAVEEHNGIYSFQVGNSGMALRAEFFERMIFDAEAAQKATAAGNDPGRPSCQRLGKDFEEWGEISEPRVQAQERGAEESS